jgi:hypothetical protein
MVGGANDAPGGVAVTLRGGIGYNVGMAAKIEIYLETAPKRTFAGAVEWPGWARSGRDEDEAIAAFEAYRDRYADVLRKGHLRPPPTDPEYRVVERLTGGAGTEYGVAGASPSADERPIEGGELDGLVRLLEAAWAAFDRAADAANGVDLAKGPRGGGRDRAKVAAHIVESEQAYIAALGAERPKTASDPFEALKPLHRAAVEALRAKARGELPEVGARGGKRWSARYFVRRATWHVLDHAWELEDRSS